MHGEHPTRRISLLIHASPGGRRGTLRRGVEWVSMSGYHLSGDVIWADFRRTDDKTQAEVVGTIKTEICALLSEPQENLYYNTHHTELRTLQSKPAKTNALMVKEGSYIYKLNVNVIHLISI